MGDNLRFTEMELSGFEDELDATCIASSLTEEIMRALAAGFGWGAEYDVDADAEELRDLAWSMLHHLARRDVIRRSDFVYVQPWGAVRADLGHSS